MGVARQPRNIFKIAKLCCDTVLGRHVCRTKWPLKKLNRYKTWFENTRKDLENDPKHVRKFEAPLKSLINFSPALSKSFFTAQNLHYVAVLRKALQG